MYSRISLKATLSVSLENFLGVLLLVCKLILRNLVEFKPFKTYSESIYFQTSINFNCLLGATTELYKHWNDMLGAIFEAKLMYSSSPFLLFLTARFIIFC